MDKVRIGIIGIGGMGSSHAGYLYGGQVPRAEVTAVCDVDESRREHARRNWDGVQVFDTAEALIGSGLCDGVMIATPHYFHPPYAIAAMQAGLHVLSEKPAGVYTKQVRQMNEVAARSDVKFALMFNQRSRPIHQKLKALIESGELGELRRSVWIITNWFRSQFYYDSGGWRATWSGEGGGVLINQCPHNIDLWQWFCGMPTRVRGFCAFGKYHHIEVEDDATAYVEYENGATGLFITTTGEAPGTNRLELTGDRGKLVMEDGHLTFWRTTGSVQRYIDEATSGFGVPETWKCELPTGGQGGEHKSVTLNWVNAILDGTPLVAPGTEGIRSLEISNAMQLSTWVDDWVTIPVDEERYLQELQRRIDSSTVKKTGGARTMSVEGTFG